MISTQTEQQRFERGIRAVFDAGQGVLTLSVLGPASSMSVVAEAMMGSATARTILSVADRTLRQIHRRSRRTALSCLLCDCNTLWRSEAPAAIAVLRPYDDEAARIALGMALCGVCVGDRDERELAHEAVSRLRTWLPGLRVFQPTAGVVGHA